MTEKIRIKFWGVRGSFPTCSESTITYGGNTSCVEVNCGDKRLILDAGTGLRNLGRQQKTTNADILLSHTHIDHILGLTSFKPFFDPNAKINIWAGHLGQQNIKEIVERIVSPPVFPIPITKMKAQIAFHDFKAGEELNFSDIKVKTISLKHPDNATAYRIEYGKSSVCYVTDVCHQPGKLDEPLLKFIKDSDLFIYDSTFTDEEFPQYADWGHSTWQEGVRLAQAAGVKKLAVFHHNPEADDKELARREKLLKEKYPVYFFARENMEIEI